MEPTLVWTETPARHPECRYVVVIADGRCAFRDNLDDALEVKWFHRGSLFLNGAAIPNETIVATGKVKSKKTYPPLPASPK